MTTSTALALAGLGVGATSAYLNNRQQNRNRQAAQEESELDRDERRETNLLDVASRESLADPFRHQVNQVDALSRLDMIANATRTPARINVPPEMQRFVPQISGGFNYDASPDLRTAAQLLARSVASGETAPTMTNPANYGLTGARNLNDPTSIGVGARPNAAAPGGGVGGAVPRTGGGTTPAMPTTASTSPYAPASSGPFSGGAAADTDAYSVDERDTAMNAASGNPYYGNYRRRKEGAGGALSNGAKYAQLGATAGSVIPGIGTAAGLVVGGVGGLIGGAFTKNAKSAMSDFYLDDAKEILRDWTRDNWGRQASEEEIQEALEGQGLQAGHRWVGQQGLDYILQQWGARNRKPAEDDDDEPFTPSYTGLFA